MKEDIGTNVMFEKYTLILKHEYEINEHGKISTIKADAPLCITCATELIGQGVAPIFINEMIDRMKYTLLKHITEGK